MLVAAIIMAQLGHFTSVSRHVKEIVGERLTTFASSVIDSVSAHAVEIKPSANVRKSVGSRPPNAGVSVGMLWYAVISDARSDILLRNM